MTIEQSEKIDFINIDDATGNVILAISDHLEWDTENEHFFLIQEKLNSYFSFIESGELSEKFPETKGRLVVIRLFLKHAPNPSAEIFLGKVNDFVESAGLIFSYEVIP